MSVDRLTSAVRYLQNARSELDRGAEQIGFAAEVLNEMIAGEKVPAHVLFCSPVTGEISQTGNPFGGEWFDATGMAVRYTATGVPALHTGADLNQPNYADSGAVVYAAADGEAVFSGTVPDWQAQVLIIRHALEDGRSVWTRYAHIVSAHPLGPVKRGLPVGTIADYNRDGPAGDHLHFDVALIDLGARPGDWPGMDRERLLASYVNPATWLRSRSK